MARRSILVAVVVLAFLWLAGASLMSAQQPAQPVNDKPLTEKWAPTEWGPTDKAGAVNRTTPAMVLKALRVVKQGKVATLGHIGVRTSKGDFLPIPKDAKSPGRPPHGSG